MADPKNDPPPPHSLATVHPLLTGAQRELLELAATPPGGLGQHLAPSLRVLAEHLTELGRQWAKGRALERALSGP